MLVEAMTAETAPVEEVDAALMARTADGDRNAFGQLVERHKDGLVAYLARLTGDPDRAEDLAQEAFLRLYRAAPRYRESGHLSAYLYRIATNLLRSEERRKRRWRLLSPLLDLQQRHQEPRIQEKLLAEEAESHLAQAVAELPLAYRVPLVLTEIEGWPQREVARMLGIAEGTVKSRLFRARARLRRTLEPYFEGGLS